MPFFCYILECADGSYYTGWAVDPHKRHLVHNSGNGARYTRIRRPTRLVYIEEMPDRSSAQKRELAIKRMDHSKKSKLIEQATCLTKEIHQQTPDANG
jgi:putative endonuclease